MLDKYGMKQLGQDISIQQDSKKMVSCYFQQIR